MYQNARNSVSSLKRTELTYGAWMHGLIAARYHWLYKCLKICAMNVYRYRSPKKCFNSNFILRKDRPLNQLSIDVSFVRFRPMCRNLRWFEVLRTVNYTKYEFLVLGDSPNVCFQGTVTASILYNTAYAQECDVQLWRAYVILCQITYLSLITHLLLSLLVDCVLLLISSLAGTQWLPSPYVILHVTFSLKCYIY